MDYNEDIYWSLFPLITLNLIVCIAFVYFAITYARRPKTAEALERLKSNKSFLGLFLFEFGYWITMPFVRFYAFLKVTPNMITALSIPMSLLTGFVIMIGKLEYAGWLIMISGNMDLVDGLLARTTGKVTKSGAYFDACMDRYSDAFVMGGLGLYFIVKSNTVSSVYNAYNSCAYNSCNTSILSKTFTASAFDVAMLITSILLIAGTSAMSYAKARGEIAGVSTKRGFMQRQERVITLGLVLILFPFMKVVCDNNDWNADYLLAGILVLMTVLVNLSAIIRTVDVFSKIKKMENNN